MEDIIDLSQVIDKEKTRTSNHLGKIAAWMAGAATSLALGVSYIGEHSADGNDIVVSTDIAGRTIGFDLSEVAIGSLALTGGVLCADFAFDHAKNFIKSRS